MTKRFMFLARQVVRESNALKGFCMGSADIVPGVSGGTMALILGIYERLLTAIRSFDKNWLWNMLRFRFKEAFAAMTFYS